MKKFFHLCLILFFVAGLLGAQSAAGGGKKAPAVSPDISAVADAAASVEVPSADLETLKTEVIKDYVVVNGDSLREISEAVFKDYRLWPIIWFTNQDSIPNPEVIEKQQEFKIYKLPFNVGAYSAVEKLLIGEAYLRAYAAYVKAGPDWLAKRRWVLLEALAFKPQLFSADAARIDAEDIAWYQKRGSN